MENTETNIAKALEYQRALEADMGGTEVLSVLSAVYNSKTVLPGDQWRREIIFLTDGDVVNHSEVRPSFSASVVVPVSESPSYRHLQCVLKHVKQLR